MRLHRFYIAEEIGSREGVSVASPELAHQIGKVFRLEVGDSVILFDGSGLDYKCEVSAISKDSITFRVGPKLPSRFMPKCRIYLYAAIVKKNNFEFIVEKATELGVTDIIPVLADRSEKKALNEERLNKIAVEASEQSGRGDVPKIHPIHSLEASIQEAKDQNVQTVVFHTEGQGFGAADLSKDAPTAVFIGPEGGWSPAELELFHIHGASVRCLGPQVLRAETAVIAALSIVIF